MLMRSTSFAGVVALALAAVTAAGARAETLNRIVATIDGEPITQVELERYAEVVKKRPGGDQVTDQKVILDELILDKIIQKQVEILGLKASDQQIDNYIESIRARNNLTEEQLLEALKQQGMTWDQYRAQVRSDIERANLINREIRTKVNVSPEEVERYYKAHLDEYGASQNVTARLISFTVPRDASDEDKAAIRAKAEEVQKRAADGGNFAKLAKEYSQGPAAEEGGDIGEVVPDEMQPEFAKAAKKLAPGEVSPLIVTPDGFHILKIEKASGEMHRPLSEVGDEIKEKLYKEAMESRYDRWLNQDLRSRHHVETFL
ncbi:MAG: peptidylprolyl isomerase [Deltaproteobacteria bacterium]|nr:peptidylprolyl isomerase [Deltaproteobacteria bacterium]